MRLLALALLGVSLCFADGTFARRLQDAARRRPKEVFVAAADLPGDLAEELALRGFPKTPLTNAAVLAIYLDLSPKPPPEPELRRVPVAPPEGQGLKILGLELGAGRDPISEDAEPYLRKGLPQLLDWDVRARVALDGLGARASYRHPRNLRSFSAGVLGYWDLPAVLGADKARDAAYRLVGAAPDKPVGGFELGVSGTINPYVGGATTYDHRVGLQGARSVDRETVVVETGYSPLGDNPGKAWNLTLIPRVEYRAQAIHDGIYASDKKGFGFSAGAAFQSAVRAAPLGGLRVDRVRVRLDLGYSEVTGAAASLAAELAVRFFSRFDLTGGARLTVYPWPDRADPQAEVLDPEAIVGAGFKY